MPTLNERAWRLCDAMAADAEELGIAIRTLACGTRILDCGVEAAGGIEAGRRLAEVCMAGLGIAEIIPEDGGRSIRTGEDFTWMDPSPLFPNLRTRYVAVGTDQPVAACMASQYAGWEIKGEKFFGMGSGPMRAAAGREELFDAIGYREEADRCVGVLECSKLPPDNVCVDVAEKCGVAPDRLTLAVAKTSSPAGTLQIVARSVETALHKLHVLGFDIAQVQRGVGVVPLPPVADNDLAAIGWTNDAILYGAFVSLVVTADDRTIDEIGPRVPSSASADFGRPFAEIFARYDNDFYRIDPMLFSPAVIGFDRADKSSQRIFGTLAPDVLLESFGASQRAE